MLSSTNQAKVLHSVLFPNESVFCIPPHDFGSTCSVHDLSPRLDKLFACVVKHVFLGYSRV